MNTFDTQSARQEILALLQIGQAEEARNQCLEFCNQDSSDTEMWLLLAATNSRLGRIEDVAETCRKVTDMDPSHTGARYNLAVALQVLGNNNAAALEYHRLLELDPSNISAYKNLGRILLMQGDPSAAEKLFRKALAIDPGRADINNHLGGILHASGHPDDAINCFHKAISSEPRNASYHFNLGNSLQALHRYSEAIQVYREALDIEPGAAGAWSNLGQVLEANGEADAALECFSKAVSLKPHDARLHFNLSQAFWTRGAWSDAAIEALESVTLDPENRLFRQNLAQAVNMTSTPPEDKRLEGELEKSFSIPGIDHQSLARTSLAILALKPAFLTLLQARQQDNARLDGNISRGRMETVSGNHLFQAILTNTILTDIQFERLLRQLRKSCLESVTNSSRSGLDTGFMCALSSQCFNNEYVWLPEAKEQRVADSLIEGTSRKLIANGFPESLIDALVVACMYTPLRQITGHERLLDTDLSALPAAVQKLIERQLLEPRKEMELREQIVTFTSVTNEISKAVQDQYEDSPYPRWLDMHVMTPEPWQNIVGRICKYYEPPANPVKDPKILIAGCGTGRHAIITATRFKNAQVLALDLSKSSLAYAMRMAARLGIENIEFGQADIIELDSMNRKFDIIESVGVLHHTSDPLLGLKNLVALLRPDGVLNTGFYSQYARRYIIAAQDYFKARGYTASTKDVIKAREAVLKLDKTHPIYPITEILDFYSLSEFRDLVFHAQEICYTLPQIAEMLDEAGLEFLDFDLTDPSVKTNYSRQYPDDRTLTDLANWDKYEQRFPDTFIEMYTFWSKKA